MYLRNIDQKWVDHLDALEEIKDAASLQGYAQKDPLVEYKKEANDTYDDMLESITEAVIKAAVNVRINIQNTSSGKTEDKKRLNLTHGRLPLRGSVVQSQAQAQNTTYRRTTPKIGRNEPCPCGSGKKYKNCCGRNA